MENTTNAGTKIVSRIFPGSHSNSQLNKGAGIAFYHQRCSYMRTTTHESGDSPADLIYRIATGKGGKAQGAVAQGWRDGSGGWRQSFAKAFPPSR